MLPPLDESTKFKNKMYHSENNRIDRKITRRNKNMNMNQMLDIAIEKDASDVHMICGNKPILRIARDLKEIEDM